MCILLQRRIQTRIGLDKHCRDLSRRTGPFTVLVVNKQVNISLILQTLVYLHTAMVARAVKHKEQLVLCTR